MSEASDNKTSVIKTSLTECRDAERFIVDGRVTAAAPSAYVPSYLIAGVEGSLVLYDMLSGRAAWKWERAFSGPVKKISQDLTGEFIAATDGASAALFRFGKKGPEHIFTKEFSGPVSAVLPSGDEKVLLVAERHGIVTAWSFSGVLLGRTDMSPPVNDIAADSKKNGFLIASGDGIYFMQGDRASVSRVSSIKADSMALDGLSGRLTVVSGPSAHIYDYPSMKRIFSLSDGFGKIAGSGGSGFAGLFVKNHIRLFDVKTGLQTATVSVTEKGSLFLPPDRAIPGVSASLMDMITGGGDVSFPDPRKVCAPVAAMVSGVYAPEAVFYREPEAATPSGPGRAENPAFPKEPHRAEAPSAGGVNGPFAAKNPAGPERVYPQAADFKGGVKAPSAPFVEPVEAPELAAEMAPSSVPSWFANRKRLPPYNAVAGASDEKAAVKGAKKQIKDAAARQMIKKLVEGKKASGIENAEIAKRFLWMTASSAANSLDGVINIADRWVSPAGQNFVLCVLDASLMDAALEDAYRKEYEAFSRMSGAEYMALKPNVID